MHRNNTHKLFNNLLTVLLILMGLNDNGASSLSVIYVSLGLTFKVDAEIRKF